MNNLYNYFNNANKNGKIVQSYLIGNVTYNKIKNDLHTILNEFIFKKNISEENNPDLYILSTDDNNISKADIKKLLNNISTTSQFNSTKVYIIDKCEKLNDFVYNAILKTLEEPKEGIYAFLLTSNIDSVKDTIASRCQKIFISSDINEDTYDEEVKKIAELLVENIETNGTKSIGLISNIYTEIEDRIKLSSVLKYILYLYHKELDNIVNEINSDSVILEKNDIESIANKMIIINNNIKLLNSNLNKNLSIDRFIIEMCR